VQALSRCNLLNTFRYVIPSGAWGERGGKRGKKREKGTGKKERRAGSVARPCTLYRHSPNTTSKCKGREKRKKKKREKRGEKERKKKGKKKGKRERRGGGWYLSFSRNLIVSRREEGEGKKGERRAYSPNPLSTFSKKGKTERRGKKRSDG